MKNAYLSLFSTPEGQRVWADLKKRFGYFTDSTYSPHPGMTELREGQRLVVSFIEKQLRAGADHDPTGEGPGHALL